MKHLAIIPLLLSCVQTGLAQPSPDTLWTRTYGGARYDAAFCVQQTADGGYAVAGYTNSFGAGDYDFYLVKTDSQGDTLWARTYGGTSRDIAYSVQPTTDGGYVVAGITSSFGSGGGDFYLVKANSQGDTLWTRTYGGSMVDGARSVQQTSDGGYVVAGYTDSFGAGMVDFYLVKTDYQGDTLWTRTYGGDSFDEAYSVQQTADGGYVVAGYTGSFGAGYSDFYLVKTNTRGDTLWTRTYGGIRYDEAYSVQQTADGGYVAAGYTCSFGAGLSDFYLVKMDSLGDTLWTHTYGGSREDVASSVQQTADGGYIVAGSTTSFGAGSDDLYLVKTDSLGDTLWTRTYGGSGGDGAYSVQQTEDGGYVVAGETRSFGVGGTNFYLVKTNSQGDTLWTRTYGGGGPDEGASVQQTSDGGYVVAGCTWSFGAGEADFYVVKTGPDISPAPPPNNPLASGYQLYANYPNPFNPVTTIRYDVGKTGPLSLKVFDLLGREVATLVEGTVPAGSYTISWDAGDLPSGLYFCRMNAGPFVQTRKMVLLR